MGLICPDVVLYEGPRNPAEDQIVATSNKDCKKVDLLLVVGTSLRIPGAQKMVRTFAKVLKNNPAKQKRSSNVRTIFISMQEPSQGGHGPGESLFDAWVEGDCQHFAEVVSQREEELQDSEQGNQDALKKYALARQDIRPLWRYY